MTKNKSKGLETQEQFASYIKGIDRLHWEFLRESPKYRKDWEHYKELSSGNPALITTEGTVTSFQSKFEQGASNMPSDLLLKYGIHATMNPDLSYEEAISLLQTHVQDKSYLFYFNLDEYAIYDGEFKQLDYEDSPFVKVTVNISLQTDILVKIFRNYLDEKKKDLFNQHLSAMPTRKWIFPKNIHVDTLEDVLTQYRMHLKGMSYRKIAEVLAKETKKDEDSLWSLVKKNIPKAQRIMKHVEKGMFP